MSELPVYTAGFLLLPTEVRLTLEQTKAVWEKFAKLAGYNTSLGRVPALLTGARATFGFQRKTIGHPISFILYEQEFLQGEASRAQLQDSGSQPYRGPFGDRTSTEPHFLLFIGTASYLQEAACLLTATSKQGRKIASNASDRFENVNHAGILKVISSGDDRSARQYANLCELLGIVT